MSTTLVRSHNKANRSSGNVIVQDYQNPAYAATIAVTTTVSAEQTTVQVAQLTGALTINIGVVNPLIGDKVFFMFAADTSNRNVTYGTGFTSSTTDTILASGTGNAEFVFNGSTWDKKSYNYQAANVDIQTPAYAATLALTTTLRSTKVIIALLTGAMAINATVTSAVAGDILYFAFSADSSGPYVVTFGTNMKSSGTLSVAASKFGSAEFIYDGAEWVMLNKTATV